jgi:hypothetical protein
MLNGVRTWPMWRARTTHDWRLNTTESSSGNPRRFTFEIYILLITVYYTVRRSIDAYNILTYITLAAITRERQNHGTPKKSKRKFTVHVCELFLITLQKHISPAQILIIGWLSSFGSTVWFRITEISRWMNHSYANNLLSNHSYLRRDYTVSWAEFFRRWCQLKITFGSFLLQQLRAFSLCNLRQARALTPGD